jgi:N-glycosylase/DNA lyase
MEKKQIDRDVHLFGVQDFDIVQTFECGQCFRFEKQTDGSYIGVAFGRGLKIRQQNDHITLFDTTLDEYQTIWESYFDFQRDYQAVKQALSKDPVMERVIPYGNGIHILHQDLWETIASFILSSSNNIPRIKKIITALSQNFGDAVSYLGNTYYSFPSAEKLASVSLDSLSVIRAGYRDKYLLDAAKKMTSGMFSDIKSLSTNDAKKLLMQINGVGTKVADCILLFGLGRTDAFPVDVWIRRIMEHCYFDDKQTIDNIIVFSREKFGNLGGFAQQYLFFYARENKII